MINGKVYRHRNKVTGKSYFGVTQNGVKERWEQEIKAARKGKGARLGAAIRRYGVKAWIHTVLATGYRTRKELHKAERRYIKKFNTTWPNGYNVTRGGDGPDYGPAFCKIQKISQNCPKAKRNHSKGAKKAAKRPEVKKRRSKAMRKVWKQFEMRKYFVKGLKKAAKHPEVKKRRSKAMKKVAKCPEVKKRRSKAAKLSWKNSRIRKRRIKAFKTAGNGYNIPHEARLRGGQKANDAKHRADPKYKKNKRKAACKAGHVTNHANRNTWKQGCPYCYTSGGRRIKR